MNDSKQLLTLVKTWGIEEQKALQYKLGVEKITKERETVYLGVLKKKKEVEIKINDWGGKFKKQALQLGDGRILQSTLAYKEKLQKELKRLEKEENEKLKELNSAIERSKLAEKEWLAARMEKQKIEKLLEKKKSATLIFDSVKDEIE